MTAADTHLSEAAEERFRSELDDAWGRFLQASHDEDAVGPYPGFRSAVLPLLERIAADKSCIEADQAQISYLQAKLAGTETEIARLTRERDRAQEEHRYAAENGLRLLKQKVAHEDRADVAEFRIAELESERDALARAEAAHACIRELEEVIANRDAAIRLMLPFVDRAAGEGLLLRGEDENGPDMDAADICVATAKALGMDLGGPDYVRVLEDGENAIRALLSPPASNPDHPSASGALNMER